MAARSSMFTVVGAPSATTMDHAENSERMVAFVADPESAAALRGAGADIDVRRGSVQQAIRYFEKETPAEAVLIDIEGVSDPRQVLDELAHVCPPYVKVFVVGDNTDLRFYRMLVQDLGVTEYMHKPLTRDNVQQVLLGHLNGGVPLHPGLRGGHVVVVCGAAGGVGTTTVAVNLALGLTEATSSHVALLDLNLQRGSAAAMLNGNPGAGLRMALDDPRRVDALFLERTAITVTPRLRLLAADEDLTGTANASEAGVARVMEVLRQKFNHIIIDLPMPPPPAMRSVIAAARHVVVVLPPTVVGVRDAQAIRRMAAIACGADRVLTVLNHADMKGGLPLPLIEKALGKRPDLMIPELGRHMVEAVNLGSPAVRRVPALSRHLSPLVQEISSVRTKPARRFRLFGR